MLEPLWVLPDLDEAAIAPLASELKLCRPAARVLWNRGYRDAAAARRFLDPSIDDLHDPKLLPGLDTAVERLLRAVRQQEKILLYGDYDVDGASSVVILKKAIELAGGTARHFVPHRLRDGYGMRSEVLRCAAAEGVKLVISVDTGIRAAAVVREAATLGLDVVITDHHLPDSELPPALAILNPNLPGCTYPDKDLCGAGVAFKLVQALLERLDWPGDKRRRMIDSFLKMVAIATIADVVPLTGENRVIVKRGLAALRNVRSPGLRALLEVSGLAEGDSPSSGQVAFRIAPRMNAAGRMASAEEVIELLLTEDEDRARALAAQLHALNGERQQTEAGIVRRVLEECVQTPVSDDYAALVFSGEGWHRGVVGIVASRLVERFHRPVFVLGEASGQAQGSGRGIRNFHLLEALESMSQLFLRFGGHKQAAGVTLACEHIAEFRERLNCYAGARLTKSDFRETIEVDARLSLDEATDDAVLEILTLAPFGSANPAPLFFVQGAELYGPAQVLKDEHRIVRLRQNNRTVRVKAWNFASHLESFAPGDQVDVILRFEDDPYSAGRGYAPWCATLKGIRRTQ
ncbi:MAG TPA: single-stranded-DNA-specific exonuclease RecJ [Bryobacteraceae bacterium]|nr:single-stranded-DNA-specific exonuclease RecJ [Bryobacteraceae bacterium]